MPKGTAGHGEHFSGNKLTLEFRRAFHAEIFLLSQLWDRVSCHSFIIAVREGVGCENSGDGQGNSLAGELLNAGGAGMRSDLRRLSCHTAIFSAM
jgi:hypothetical protein